MILNFEKTILNTIKFHNGLKNLFGSIFLSFSTNTTNISLNFSQELTQQEIDEATTYVNGFVNYTSAEQLSIYLDQTVFPFVKELINTFAAENISMGITQAGKTGQMLAMYSKKMPVPSETFQVSLKDSLDTGSLYIAIDVLKYIRANPLEYDGLNPFITDARLLTMINNVETFLGIPLTEI